MSIRVKEIMDLGPFSVNCYLVICEESKKALVIDPGDYGEQIVAVIEEEGVEVEGLYTTHGHLDHVMAAAYVSEKVNAPFYVPMADEPMYQNLPYQCETFGLPRMEPVADYQTFTPDTVIKVGNRQLKLLSTPGHSPGSVCFLIEESDKILVGDLLFFGGVGRTDLWMGDVEALRRSLTEITRLCNADTTVYPGHGRTTTIGWEQAHNPFLSTSFL